MSLKGTPRVAFSACALSLVLISLALLSACGGGASLAAGDSSTAPVLTTISVSPNAASIVVGSTKQFQAIAKDRHGSVMSGVSFVFSSSGSAATVDNAGLAKGMSVGTAAITASAAGVSGSVPLTVIADPPSSVLTQISVSPSTASIQPGQQQSYTAVGYDQFNNVMSGLTFTWSSDGNSSVAILNGNVATGAGPGTIHITASTSGVTSAPASLTVTAPPPSLTTIMVTPATSSIFIGGSQQLTAVGYDQYGTAISGITFTWSSTNPNVTPVSGAGLASGVAVGTVQITASASGVSSSPASLTVSKPASVLSSITVSPASASIQAGSTQEFGAVGFDQYGNPMSGIVFTWSSSNPNIASVTAVNSEGKNDGVAAGIAAGSTQITVSANGVSAAVPLTVTAAPPPPPPPVVTSINVTSANTSITAGETQQFSALAFDQHGLAMSGITFTWASSDSSVATVDTNGLATGLTAGTVQIIASAQSAVSNGVSLTVTAAPCNCPISISKLSPPMALVGSGDLISLTIFGSGFASGALVNFGSNILTPTSVSPTSIVVTVPAAELTSVTPANQPVAVSVTNPAPYAGTSGSLPFSITNHGMVSINFDDGYQLRQRLAHS
jgi:hypothetical protein